MENILNCNKESHLLDSLKSIPIDTTFHHGIAKNIPNLIKSQVYIEPENRQDQKYIFQLPGEGFLLGVAIESKLTAAGDNREAEERIGTRVFSSIHFKQANLILASNCPDYIEARIDDSPRNEQEAFDEMTNPDADWNNNQVTLYTPLFFSFTDTSNNSLLLNYFRQLEIEANYNENLDTTLDSAVTAKSFRLVCFVAYLEDNYYNSYIYNVYNEKFFNIFSYDKYVQKFSLDNASTSKKVHFECYRLIFAIHLIIKDSQNDSQVQVKTLNVTVNGGQEIVNTNKQLNYYDTGRQKDTGNVASNQGNMMFSYYFGLNKSREYHSGAVNTIQCQDMHLDVSYETLSGSNYQLIVVAEYFRILQADRLGRIDVSL